MAYAESTAPYKNENSLMLKERHDGTSLLVGGGI